MNTELFDKYSRPAEPVYSNEEEHRDIYICRLKPQLQVGYNHQSNYPHKIVVKTLTITGQELQQTKWRKELSNTCLEKNKLIKFKNCEQIVNCLAYRKIVNKNGDIVYEIGMEYLPRDLKQQRQRMKQKNEYTNFTMKHIVKIIKDILLGIEEVHDQNIIHCDLKFPNVLYQPKTKHKEMAVKLTDFGAARTTVDKYGNKHNLKAKHIKAFSYRYVGMYSNIYSNFRLIFFVVLFSFSLS